MTIIKVILFAEQHENIILMGAGSNVFKVMNILYVANLRGWQLTMKYARPKKLK